MNGLVLAGGKSTRMGQDKSLLKYYSVPQYQHVYELLKPFCNEVYISSNTPNKINGLPIIKDAIKYNNIGPMAAILSAFEFKFENWLVVAIDYPLLDSKSIQYLVQSSEDCDLASVYYNQVSNFYEPYIGLYRKEIYNIILEEFHNKNYSLQKLLVKHQVNKVYASNLAMLESIDTLVAKNNLKL